MEQKESDNIELRSEKVSHNHNRLSFVELIQVLYDASLIVGIERVGRLVRKM